MQQSMSIVTDNVLLKLVESTGLGVKYVVEVWRHTITLTNVTCV